MDVRICLQSIPNNSENQKCRYVFFNVYFKLKFKIEKQQHSFNIIVNVIPPNLFYILAKKKIISHIYDGNDDEQGIQYPTIICFGVYLLG